MNQLTLPDFGSPVIEDAFQQIVDEGLNYMYCSLTGAPVGRIDDSEVRLCLQMEFSRNVFATADKLADSFALRASIYSSGPAPSLRVHKDNKTMIYMLRNDPAGHNRLFTYLAGRLFFDAMTPTKLMGSSIYGAARLSFLRELLSRLENLGKGWEDSLTPNDENPDGNPSVIDMPATVERKAAARSLDLMLRLDSIHNIRYLLIDQTIRDRLINMREVTDEGWTFSRLSEVLTATESDGLLRLARGSQRDVSGNSMVITTLLERLRWGAKRVERYMGDLERIPESRFKEGTTGSQLLAHVSEMLSQDKLSKRDREHLESVSRQILITGKSPSWSDKRLDSLNHKIARSAEANGSVIVRKGDAATKAMAESYLQKGIALKPELKAEMERIIAEGTIRVNKATREIVSGEKEVRVPGQKKPKTKKMAVAVAKNFAAFERFNNQLKEGVLPANFTDLLKKKEG